MKNERPVPAKADQKLANYIAMVIRNAMEDFHCEHLTDDQMRKLNPIIRNAICTALHAFNNYESVEAAASFVNFHMCMVPKYWEEPELLEDYVQVWEQSQTSKVFLNLQSSENLAAPTSDGEHQ